MKAEATTSDVENIYKEVSSVWFAKQAMIATCSSSLML